MEKKKKERKERNPQRIGKASLKKAENIWRLPSLACAFRNHRVTDMGQIRIKDAYKRSWDILRNN